MKEGYPVAYESQRLDALEQTLGIYEKEFIAIIHVLQTWKHYCELHLLLEQTIKASGIS